MAIDLQLEYRGGGHFQCRTKLDFELAAGELQAGERVRAKVTRQRSVRQNRLFHAIVETAYENQRAGPLLPTWRHLKSWLLIQIGHCEVKKFEPGAITPEVAAYLRKMFDTVDFTTDGKSIFMKTARSVNFTDGATAEEMRAIVDQVIEVICQDICPGMKPDDLRREAEDKVKPMAREREAA